MDNDSSKASVGSRVSRRGVLKGALALGGLAVAPGLAACGSSSPTPGGSASETSGGGAGQTLNMLTWQGYHDNEWLADFAKTSGITVNAASVGSPAEMFAKVKAAPEQYDLVLATAGWFEQYASEQLLVPIDQDRVTALDDIKLGFDWKKSTTVDDQMYGVLYNWGNQPLAWLDGTIPTDGSVDQYLGENGLPDDWNILWDPAFTKKVSIFDDPTSVMPMIPLALGMPDPFHLTDEQLDQVQEKLMALRPQVPRLTSGFDDQTQQLAKGEATIAYLNIITVQAELAKLGKKLLVNNTVKQGVPSWSDNYAITNGGAQKKDAVYAFINATLTVPWQAKFISASGNNGTLDFAQATSSEAQSAGLTKAQLDATLIPATEEGEKLWSKLIFFQAVENLDKRLQIWNEFKLGVS